MILAVAGFDNLAGADVSTAYPFSRTTFGGAYGIASGRLGGNALEVSGTCGNFLQPRATAMVGVVDVGATAWRAALAYLPEASTFSGNYIPTFRFLEVVDGADSQCYLCLTPLGRVQLYRNETVPVLLAQSDPYLFTFAQWCHWEVLLTLGASDSVTVWLNNQQVLTASGLQTLKTGITTGDRLLLGQGEPYDGDAGERLWGAKLDDLLVGTGDEARFYDRHVYTLFPVSEGATIEWTPSTGSDNALNVDEHDPNGDTDYNSASVAPKTDLYVFEGLPGPIDGAIVQLSAWLRKDNTGDVAVAPLVGSDVGIAQAIQLDYRRYHQIYPVDPNDSTAWTQAKINGYQYGVQRTS